MTTQRAPSSRAARVAWASSSGAPVGPILRTASHTRSRPTTVRPSTHLRSAVTVSAILAGKAGRIDSPAVAVISGRNVALPTVRRILAA